MTNYLNVMSCKSDEGVAVDLCIYRWCARALAGFGEGCSILNHIHLLRRWCTF